MEHLPQVRHIVLLAVLEVVLACDFGIDGIDVEAGLLVADIAADRSALDRKGPSLLRPVLREVDRSAAVADVLLDDLHRHGV